MSEVSTLNRQSDSPMSSLPIGQEESGRCSVAVRRVNPLDYPGWDSLLTAHPDRNFFHSTAWASVLHETYRCSPVYFTVFRGDCLAALLPVMEMDSWLTGRRGVALPFSDACEPLGDGSRSKDLIAEVLHYGRERDWKYFECRGKLFNQAQPFQTFFIHELKLFKDETHLFARVKSAARGAVRKAEKSGVTIEISQTLEAVERYYSLHCQTRKKHGVPPQPFAFFQNIQKYVLAREKGIVVLARHRQNLIAGAIYFHFGEKAIHKFGASDAAFQDFCGNNLVMWSAMKWYASKCVALLHFGRTSIGNEGLRKFKLGWGAEERQIDYFRYDFRHDHFVTGKDGAVGWYNSVFRRAPVFASRMIGAALYRHVA